MENLTAESIAIESAQNADKRVRLNAGVFLAQIDTPESQAAVKKLLRDPDRDVRQETFLSFIQAEGKRRSLTARRLLPWSPWPMVAGLAISVIAALALILFLLTRNENLSAPEQGGWLMELFRITVLCVATSAPVILFSRPVGVYPKLVSGCLIEVSAAAIIGGVVGIGIALHLALHLSQPMLFSALVGAGCLILLAAVRAGAALAVPLSNRRRLPIMVFWSTSVLIGMLVLAYIALAIFVLSGAGAEQVGRIIVYGTFVAVFASVSSALVDANLPIREGDLSGSLGARSRVVLASSVSAIVVLSGAGLVALTAKEAPTEFDGVSIDGRQFTYEEITKEPMNLTWAILGRPIHIEATRPTSLIFNAYLESTDIVLQTFDPSNDARDRIDSDPDWGREIWEATIGDPTLAFESGTPQAMIVCVERYSDSGSDREDACRLGKEEKQAYESLFFAAGAQLIGSGAGSSPSDQPTSDPERTIQVTLEIGATPIFQSELSDARTWFNDMKKSRTGREEDGPRLVLATSHAQASGIPMGSIGWQDESGFTPLFAGTPIKVDQMPDLQRLPALTCDAIRHSSTLVAAAYPDLQGQFRPNICNRIAERPEAPGEPEDPAIQDFLDGLPANKLSDTSAPEGQLAILLVDSGALPAGSLVEIARVTQRGAWVRTWISSETASESVHGIPSSLLVATDETEGSQIARLVLGPEAMVLASSPLTDASRLDFIGPVGTIDFGDDTSEYALNSECNDSRFQSQKMEYSLFPDAAFRDATDCTNAVGTGLARYAEEEVIARLQIPEFGDDTSRYANDGECDDPRFAGVGSAFSLRYEHLRADATDCREAFNSGRVEYLFFVN